MPLKNRKQSANIHDKRHENGLAPPAVKKSSRSKFDPSTDADLDLQPSSSEIGKTSALEAPDSDDSDTQLIPDAGADGTATTNHMAASGKTGSDEGSENVWDASADATADEAEPPAAVTSQPLNGSASLSDKAAANSSNDIAASLISTHPHRDVVAILLFLLQLPPSLLIVVQLWWAVMTIRQPSTVLSFSSLPTWPDWFHGNTQKPSVLTIIVSDLLFVSFWLILTNLVPVSRDIILDLAQSVIAMALGGGSLSTDGWNYSIACISLVTIPHVLQSRTWRQYTVDPLVAVVSRASLGSLTGIPFLSTGRHYRHSWPRSILELHILAQGAYKVIHRWIDRQPGTASVKRVDPEAATVSFNLASAASNNPGLEGVRNASSDGRPPGPSPAAKEAKEKNVSSGKKRRKQGNFVKQHQPLWAALAEGIIAGTKATEHTQATKDSSDALAAEILRRGDTDGDIVVVEDRVWISAVDHGEVHFVAVLQQSGRLSDRDEASSVESAVLSVRVNGARWNQLDYRSVDQITSQSVKQRIVKGRIYGLSPSEGFFIEFVDRAQERVIHSTNLVTRPLATSDTGTAAPSSIPAQSQDVLRPSSPATTLKKAMAAAEHQLNELRAKSKKARRDHKTGNTNLKREVDTLENRLASSSGADERQRQRQAQFRQNIKTAEETVAAINQQIDELADIPENEQQTYNATHEAWQEESVRRTAAREELEKARLEAERQIAALKAEHSNVRAKIEKAETRLVNQEQKRETLHASTTQARREKSRWDAQRTALIATWQTRERDLISACQYIESQRLEIEARTAQLQQHSYFLENNYGVSNGHATIQNTPELPFASIANSHRVSAFTNLNFPISSSSPFHSRENSFRQPPRGRSSSMLSAISGFTEDETPPVANYAEYENGANTTAGAQSHGLARNGSISDAIGTGSLPVSLQGIPRSPGPGYGPMPKLSPIGSEARRNSGSPRGSGS